MNIGKMRRFCRGPRALAICALLSCGGFGPVLHADAADSQETAVKVLQQSSFNVLTGNWDVALERNAIRIAEDFKSQLPRLDYHLVAEKAEEKAGLNRIVLTFRGEGDQKVVLKLKEMNASTTNVRLRVGLTGSETKSAELFKYVFTNM